MNSPSEIIQVPVWIRSENSGHVAEGSIWVVRWTPQERLRRAFKTGGIFFGIGVASILIPIAHFFLVPAFILSSPLVGLWVYGQKSQIQRGQGPCPDCAAELRIPAGPERFPGHDVCEKCRNGVQINLEASHPSQG